MVAGVSRGARIDRALRYRWCGVALGVAGMGMLCGFTLVGAVAAVGGVGLALFRLVRGDESLLPMHGTA